jgi:hypothetical protein
MTAVALRWLDQDDFGAKAGAQTAACAGRDTITDLYHADLPQHAFLQSGPLPAQRPLKFGVRFSRKAVMPSFLSAVP